LATSDPHAPAMIALRKRLRNWLWARGESFRKARMQQFVNEFQPTADMRILDVGGTDLNWRIADQPAHVVLLNTRIPEGADVGLLGSEYGDRQSGSAAPNVEYVLGDGKSVPYEDGEFDICFSNSTIEHLFTFEGQRAFASEVRRVGREVWVQTPARSFPFEPHWLSPLIHWLPKRLQRRLGRNFTVYGWMLRPTTDDVSELVDELRLLSRREMQGLFPDCEIRRERFLGLTKSYIAVRRRP
jgi:Methyltransferase domain